MAKLTVADWLEEGFSILSEFAQNKLRILYLCERLKVTRGSFYHHFNSIEHYITELMNSWEKSCTLECIRHSNQAKSPEQRLELLLKRIMKANQSIEEAIRSWSFYHPIVKTHLKKVDEIRIAYLQGIFEEMGMGKELSEKRAQLDYALLVGLQQLFPAITAKEMAVFFKEQRHD